MKALLLTLSLVWFVQWQPSYASEPNPARSTVVFVHGSWGGGWDYKGMEALLRAEGYSVYRPTLTGLGERAHLLNPSINLDTHITDIVNLLKYEDLSDVILVGHSYGGMIITGVADRAPEKIKHLFYTDALLPLHGESAFDLLGKEIEKNFEELAEKEGDGWNIPPFWPDWGKDVPHPIETYRQPISLTNTAAQRIPATYLLTLEPGAEDDLFSKFAERARSRGWKYCELRTGHNPQRTMPEELARMIMDIQ